MDINAGIWQMTFKGSKSIQQGSWLQHIDICRRVRGQVISGQKRTPSTRRGVRQGWNCYMKLGAPRETILPIIKHMPVWNFCTKVCLNTNERIRGALELWNGLESFMDVEFATRDAQLNEVTFPTNLWRVLTPTHKDYKISSLRMLNLSFLSGRTRKA